MLEENSSQTCPLHVVGVERPATESSHFRNRNGFIIAQEIITNTALQGFRMKIPGLHRTLLTGVAAGTVLREYQATSADSILTELPFEIVHQVILGVACAWILIFRFELSLA